MVIDWDKAPPAILQHRDEIEALVAAAAATST
jgi:hypothetical protein